MKILIRGAGFENKGAEAMLRVAQRELGKRIPDASFYATVSPLEAPYAYRAGIVPLFYAPSPRMQMLRTIPFAPKVPEFLLAKKNPDFARAVKIHTKAAYEINAIGAVDAVLDVSGFSYSDSWGSGGFKYAWPWLEYCQLKNKPYIFLPQAWGPFEKVEVSQWAKKLCSAGPMIISRDDESSKYLAKLQGISVGEVLQSPDIAFRFLGDPTSVGRSILDEFGLGVDRPVIGVVPNMRVYERSPGAGVGNHYIKLLVALVDYCISSLNVDVLLLPNEIKVPGNTGPDDRFLCSIVASQIQNPARCHAVRDYFSAEAIKSVLGQLDLLIASRFHSLVFALGQGVPSVALGWSHKYQELLRPFKLGKFVVDHHRFDIGNVISLVGESWRERNNNKKNISIEVAGIKESIDYLFDNLSKYIEKFRNYKI
ncbi:polysaccharide pyruvyl transferase family protein [Geoalkalibacter halelectricus]|uniref:Polysaccharide pyruvyl transferase family protein n=1 Tax=Geoalkalibacter halelectricus TaxID=2847045 RepID=A0ABY5ZJP1_9BACT|nr:polysaccharide pyruvyl transferase family protein [Geoalkalibacter halelectricus]MDO3379729.1 polysaccharide pyruvyl transferase family protein [Geoalkalibacter halelectricus]UWZ79263.1 polysaccharide pyruvyl transferase family protein [Geoalkalibacter halelectricus]